MSKHTEHLPLRDLNKRMKEEGTPPSVEKALAAAQGKRNKMDAKNARKGQKPK